MSVRLKDIAEVAIGYQHREKVSHAEHGTHRLIQGKDVMFADDGGDADSRSFGWTVRLDKLDRVTPKGDAQRYRLRPGDVLFVSRGTTNVAVPLVASRVQPSPDDWDELIPAYTFYVIRPDHARVRPEYLAWYINTPPAQAYLAQQSRGTLVKLLPKSEFEELEIPVPSLDVQQQVIALEESRAHEEQLLRRLIACRQRHVQQVCLQAVSSDHPILPS